MKKIAITICLMAVTPVVSQQVIAHGGATGIVKERMDLMVDMKDAVKAVSAIFKGETAYNPDTIRSAAAIIRDHSGEAMIQLFPEGSLTKHSEAKPELWQEWQRFKQLAERQTNLAEGLYRAADNQQGLGIMDQSNGQHMMGSGGMMGQQNSGHMMGQQNSGHMMGQQNSRHMMGSNGMMKQNNSGHMMDSNGKLPMDDPEHLAQMPSSMVFKMLTDNCGSCHESYRVEKE